MKYFKIIAASVCAVAVFCLAAAGVARAQQFSPSISKKQTVNSSLFSAAKTVVIEGVVNGDVYCAGQDVTVAGTVHGDVICAGQRLTISGTVDGSIRAAGQDVTVSAKIGHNITVAGQRVAIAKEASIGQDAVVAGSDINLAGFVKRDAIVSGSAAKVSADIDRNLRFGGTQLSLENGATIKGDVHYTSDRAISVNNGAAVKGATVHQTPQKNNHRGYVFGRSIGSSIAIIASFVVFCLFLVWFFPRQTQSVSQLAVDSLGKVMLIGFVSIFAVPFSISVLAATLLGIPIAVLALLVSLIVMVLSGPVAAYYFGSMVWSSQHNPVKLMLLGSALLAVVFLVPIAGALITFIAYLIGSGALVLWIVRNWPRPQKTVK